MAKQGQCGEPLCEHEIEQLRESVTFALLVQGFGIERFEDIGLVLLG